MRKAIIILSLAAVAVFSAFNLPSEEEKSIAKVNSVDGYLVFIQCTPVAQFETLGDVKASASWSGSPTEMFNSMLNKIKKEFPKADAVVFEDLKMKHGTAIKWK